MNHNNRVDLLAKTNNGERIIVEVQYLGAWPTARAMVETLKLGEFYINLKKVYSISLLYFEVSWDGDDYIYYGKTEFTGFHTHNPVALKKFLVGDQIRIGDTNIFPGYYLTPLKRFTDVIWDDLDQWVYAFKTNEIPDELAAPVPGR